MALARYPLAIVHPYEPIRNLCSVPVPNLGKAQIGADMCFCPKVFKVPLAFDQDLKAATLLSDMTYTF